MSEKSLSPAEILKNRVSDNEGYITHALMLFQKEQEAIGAFARDARSEKSISIAMMAYFMVVEVSELRALEEGGRWTDDSLKQWADAYTDLTSQSGGAK